jgi:hypothetical protein
VVAFQSVAWQLLEVVHLIAVLPADLLPFDSPELAEWTTPDPSSAC